MRSNYKKIGRYVQQANKRNKDMAVTNLRGININKLFMPSVANTVGVDLSKYKIVSKHQFAFNPMHVGRDEMLPISMLEADDPVIVSPAYVVFEIKDHEALDPEYLMMWCRRPEFDRNAWFTTDSSVRGGFSWSDFCDMELPVPSIEKQREIVREYNTIVNRIQLNEQLNQKLEETAQAIYKHWFVDFEFPISAEYAASIGKPELEGKPYKSNGGEMVFCEELEQEIPKGWTCSIIEKVIQVRDGTHDSPKPTEDSCYKLVTSTHLKPYDVDFGQAYKIREEDFEQINKRSKVRKYDILFSMIGTIGLISYVLCDEINFAIKNVGLFKTSQKKEWSEFILGTLKSENVQSQIRTSLLGSTQNYVTLTGLRNIQIIIPSDSVIQDYRASVGSIIQALELRVRENRCNNILIDTILAKMAVTQCSEGIAA
jgi:type I restriction enzyme, S subunit